jgi:hypothetical protein
VGILKNTFVTNNNEILLGVTQYCYCPDIPEKLKQQLVKKISELSYCKELQSPFFLSEDTDLPVYSISFAFAPLDDGTIKIKLVQRKESSFNCRGYKNPISNELDFKHLFSSLLNDKEMKISEVTIFGDGPVSVESIGDYKNIIIEKIDLTYNMFGRERNPICKVNDKYIDNDNDNDNNDTKFKM